MPFLSSMVQLRERCVTLCGVWYEGVALMEFKGKK